MSIASLREGGRPARSPTGCASRDKHDIMFYDLRWSRSEAPPGEYGIEGTRDAKIGRAMSKMDPGSDDEPRLPRRREDLLASGQLIQFTRT